MTGEWCEASGSRRGMVDERVLLDGWDKERLRDVAEWVKWVQIERNMAGLRRDYGEISN